MQEKRKRAQVTGGGGLRFFFADIIFAKGVQLKIIIFLALLDFALKQHLGPGINHFRN